MSHSAVDELWMRRALRLALRSLGRTWPNPGVGAVVVREGRLLGQGRHERCGEGHAEVMALADCRCQGHDPAGATVYVTLAPCTRHGRTPPCCAALAAAGVQRVVAAIADPVQDAATEVLAATGIQFSVGCLAAEARELHAGFLSRVTRGRPRCIAKWAASLDGCIATSVGHSAWISAPEALAFSRRHRRYVDAILVGSGTARADDPRLLAPGAGPHPLRIVLDGAATLDPGSRLVATLDQAPLLLVHDQRAAAQRLEALRQRGVQLLLVGDSHDPLVVVGALAAHGLNDVLVEGGATLHGAWLRAGVYDRLECYFGARTIGGGRGVAGGRGVDRIDDATNWIPTGSPRLLGTTLYQRFRRSDDSCS